MSDRLRIGVLGTGAIVHEFHLPSLLANPRVQVKALGNLHPASLRQLANRSQHPFDRYDFIRIRRSRPARQSVRAYRNVFSADPGGRYSHSAHRIRQRNDS